MPEARVLRILLMLLLPAASAVAQEADGERPSGDGIEIGWEVISNVLEEEGRFRSALTLRNRSEDTLGVEGWALHFNFARIIDPESLTDTVTITHVNGDFYRLEPGAAFPALPPGDILRIPFEAEGWAIKESDAPSGFYMIHGDLAGEPHPVTAVRIAAFETEEQTSRGRADGVPVPTAASRYRAARNVNKPPSREIGRLVPEPSHLREKSGRVVLDRGTEILHEEGLASEAAYLAGALEPVLGGRIRTRTGRRTGSDRIVLRRREGERKGTREENGEAYRMRVDPEDGITISGRDAAGVFYGIQTLRALVPPSAYREARDSVSIEAAAVEDAPRFAYRGLHLDVSRNFQTVETVEKLLELMATYKLNRFHFHLTDDEGWRLAIDDLPELTEVGGRRGHTVDERDHLIPSLGSGPDPDASSGSGHYTREEFIHLLRYAHERHIEVIPEIDVPGHARAAIKAMRARYHRLVAEGRGEDARNFLLHDIGDESEYRSVQGWTDNVINVCQESTYRFLEAVVDDVVRMYEEAEVPLTTIHVGGDEVPAGVWERSPACERLLREPGYPEDTGDLLDYFVDRMVNLLGFRGLVTAGWEEIALRESSGDPSGVAPDSAFVGRPVRAYVWSNIWGSGGEDGAYKLANAGFDVVMSHASNLYFDLAYTKDPAEEGLYWSGFVGTREPFEFVPFDIYRTARKDVMGGAIAAPDAFSDHESLAKAGREHILGIQGQLWGETLHDPERVEYMVAPRLLALAERAWAEQPDWVRVDDPAERRAMRDDAWREFAHRLGRRELPRLDGLGGGVRYRLPPPGAIIEGGVLKANVAFPGLAIRYTTDGTEPGAGARRYTGPVPVEGTVKLKTFDTRGRGSRTVTLSH